MKRDKDKAITKRTYNLIANKYTRRDKRVEEIEKEFDIKPDLENFIKVLPKGARVLDIGCGAGRDTRFFSRHGRKVIGIDFSASMIAQAKALSKNEIFKVVDFEQMKFKKNQFDGIWANASLHHIPKKRLVPVLKKIHSFLRLHGYFFIKVRRGAGQGLTEKQKFGRPIKRYFSFYQAKELRSILKFCAFKILSSRTDLRRGWISVLASKL